MSPEEKIIKIFRNELYDQVWKTPRSRLAEKYGISDVMLSKICRKLKVPTPSRGYWSKLEFGKKVKRPTLPKIGPDDPTAHTIHLRPLSHVSSQADSQIENIKIPGVDSKKRIRVPQKLRTPHPLVEETRKVLSKTRSDDYGVLRPWRKKYLNMRIGPKSLNRALRIMDTVIKQFESKGFKVSTEAGQYSRLPSTYVEISGEKVHFSLNESVRRIDPTSIDEMKNKNKIYNWREGHQWAYYPTGKLSLRINEYATCGKKKKYSDTSSECVEDQLSDFFVCAAMIADVLKQRRAKQEEEEKKWQEIQRKREEEEKQRRLEEERLRDLEKQAEQWDKSQKLRAYIQAVEKISRSDKCSEDIKKRIEKWLSWAKEHADRIDPLSGIPLRDNSTDKED